MGDYRWEWVTVNWIEGRSESVASNSQLFVPLPLLCAVILNFILKKRRGFSGPKAQNPFGRLDPLSSLFQFFISSHSFSFYMCYERYYNRNNLIVSYGPFNQSIMHGAGSCFHSMRNDRVRSSLPVQLSKRSEWWLTMMTFAYVQKLFHY